ncbi:glycosyltransferase family 2 protein [Methylobacterium organophilum]|uniref:glycosyltransferase n=1 Tax=Methylobacterium organophilum TaxID=410 RepID=UPI001F12AF58|nr:glycosyltransferase [Methylobacterium organophilum]UMY18493.1 glycosyltransferase family 2 protein [Methylobacterium organophilum]
MVAQAVPGTEPVPHAEGFYRVCRLSRTGLPECVMTLDHDGTAPLPSAEDARPLRVVVAVPVRNEAERIGACLAAFAAQGEIGTSGLGIVLFLNNCTDATAAVVASLRPHLPFPVRVIARVSAGANAGWARREAMEEAARWLEAAGASDGVILTSDADSRVAPDWVARNLAAIAAGADAVAGRIALDADDAARLPAALHARGRLEGTYEALLTELEARIDPIPHDPWPRHWTTSGATLAVRLPVYRQVGGMPALAVGEDRAFVSSLLSSDARVRHDPDIVVVTSGRLDGRAPGGAADTMKRRCAIPESPCDPRLETLPRALFRFATRRWLRRLHASGRLARTALWAPWLGLRADRARAIAGLPSLGAVLAVTELESPRLVHHPLRPSQLPGRIRQARACLALLRASQRLVPGRLPRPGAATVMEGAGKPPIERAGHA